ncbi:MAG: hypothetical protein DDT31_01418 [Syntrophomonadaceae bacterium]|nr:hypothetical protein [Bacillota bacterium]
MVEHLRLFDINAYVGKPCQPWSGEWHDRADTLLAEMDYYGIEKAIITHYTAKQAHPDIGNNEVLRFTAEDSRILPSWAFVPSTGKTSDALQVIESALRAGAKLLRYYPNEYFVPLSEYAIGDFLEIMEHRRVPLFVDFSIGSAGGEFETDWEGLISICKRYKDLPVITSEFRIRSNRMLFRALALCANLKVCTSGIWCYKNIDHIVREFGKHRLVFGTSMPCFEPSIPISMLRYAEFSVEVKIAIGSENIENLLSGVKL